MGLSRGLWESSASHVSPLRVQVAPLGAVWRIPCRRGAEDPSSPTWLRN